MILSRFPILKLRRHTLPKSVSNCNAVAGVAWNCRAISTRPDATQPMGRHLSLNYQLQVVYYFALGLSSPVARFPTSEQGPGEHPFPVLGWALIRMRPLLSGSLRFLLPCLQCPPLRGRLVGCNRARLRGPIGRAHFDLVLGTLMQSTPHADLATKTMINGEECLLNPHDADPDRHRSAPRPAAFMAPMD